MHRYKGAFLSEVLFSDEFLLNQPKTNMFRLFKKSACCIYCWNYYTCSYDISLVSYFQDLEKKLGPILKGLTNIVSLKEISMMKNICIL